MEKDVNFNYNQCIKEKDNIGETIYYNICNNESYIISWGSLNWLLWLLVLLLIISLIFTIFYGVKGIKKIIF